MESLTSGQDAMEANVSPLRDQSKSVLMQSDTITDGAMLLSRWVSTRFSLPDFYA